MLSHAPALARGSIDRSVREGSGAPTGSKALRLKRLAGRAKRRFERRPQRRVRFSHRREASEVGETGHSQVRLPNPAGRDAGKMREVGIDVQRDAVKRRPAPHAHADRGDLVLGFFAARRGRVIRTRDPHADPVLARVAYDVEGLQRLDQPTLQRGDIGAHVGPAALEVEHDIGDPLPRPMIGELAAAAGAIDRKARVDEVAVLGAGAGGGERRMLDEPTRSGFSSRAIASARVSMSLSASGNSVSPGVTAHSTGGAPQRASKGARGARRELSTRALYQTERMGASGGRNAGAG